MDSKAETKLTSVQITDEETSLFAMQLASSSVLPMALHSGLELGLLEIKAKNAFQMLLSVYSILTCSVRKLPDGNCVERLYGLGPVCKYLIKNEDGVSIAPLCLMNQDNVFMES
ncbi:hypothetical protein Bca52824_031290 [Brassica carinata]|uniref:Uncharacterized protein n=1 Tax=Brassica carinata TaxID=52824 RepID=A0A8X7V559_BRACI|nr:hypothetical protein Bca52824_031290 [Brassica carinata]